jgi:hypothetical protein
MLTFFKSSFFIMLSGENKPTMLSVVMLNVIMLCVVMLNVIMLSAIMLNVIMLSVVLLCGVALHLAIKIQFYIHSKIIEEI